MPDAAPLPASPMKWPEPMLEANREAPIWGKGGAAGLAERKRLPSWLKGRLPKWGEGGAAELVERNSTELGGGRGC